MMVKLRMAAAGLLAAPLLADASLGEVYGRLHMSADYTSNGARSAVNVSSNASHVGFRGSQPIGGSLEGIYQLESEFAGDVGGGEWAVRDTYVGLRGALGEVRLGRFGTPARRVWETVDFFPEQVGDARNLIRGDYMLPGADAPLQGFDERLNNSVYYRTPRLGSWQADIHYSTHTGEERYVDDNDRDAVSTSISYRYGNLYMATAHENYSRDRHVNRFAGAYDAGPMRVAVFYQKAGDPDDRAWGVGTRYGGATAALKMQYYQLDAAEAGLGAAMWALGVAWDLVPQFGLYLTYAQVRNDSRQTLAPFIQARGVEPDEVSVEPGSNPRAVALGAVYRF
ncbi:hypothetical protein CAI21_00235 [Alkalilimnicola ehrlichii]|uniref:Porin domain-containing protein n=1 Tax=Alkalilimnicola ehrlichii TaxID=351052 RepID=A0A3E0X4X5_9GAMM|nr:porin [Alkalilimnicola ehrlichii]RFA31127.1 hypothetical protein CAI21_00235 [Alkalilimnicola ehrlichii]RFA39586.1 hypothetical protein CAL65_02170 [Alkalilimnicola ehrlichii]